MNFGSILYAAQQYMSPEVLQGNNYSFASDIWSLGVLMYELMNLNLPSESSNLITHINLVFPEKYSKTLQDIVKEMLLEEPFQRASLQRIQKKLNSYDSQENTVTKLESEVIQQRETIHQLEEQNQILSNCLLIQEGMNLLRNHLFDKKIEKQVFSSLKKVADDHNDAEALWRVSACFLRGIGTQKDKKMAQIYAKKSMEQDSVDGIYQ
jgi:serine/threonine protein kinase